MTEPYQSNDNLIYQSISTSAEDKIANQKVIKAESFVSNSNPITLRQQSNSFRVVPLKEELRLKVKEATELKKCGNEFFEAQNYEKSILYYEQALNHLKFQNDYDKLLLASTNIDNIKIECFNNISVCYLLRNKFEKALEMTEQTLSIQKKNYKALYIQSRIYKRQNKIKEACESLKKVRNLTKIILGDKHQNN